MQNLKMMAVVAGFFLLAGCRPVVSLQPYYFDEDVVFDEALLGTWEIKEDGSMDQWIFTRVGLDRYEMVLKGDDKEDTMVFEARAFRLADAFFLDLYPEETKEGEFFRFDLLPAHTLMRYEIREDGLHLYLIDELWLDKNLDSGKFQIANTYLREEGSSGFDIVLTAETEQLQDFIVNSALKDKEAFEDPSDTPFTKIK